MIKQVVTTLRMMPLMEQVAVQFAGKQVEDGVFVPHESQEKAAHAMLDELVRWAGALQTLRD